MNTSEERHIRELLSRYMDGETTVEEESELSAFFACEGDNLPEDLKDYRRLFELLNPAEPEGECPEGLRESIGRKIDRIENGYRLRTRIAAWLSVAAVVTVMMIVGMRIYNADDMNLRNLSEASVTAIAGTDTSELIAASLNNKEPGDEAIKEEGGKVEPVNSVALPRKTEKAKTVKKTNVRVVNDPEEAARILAMALSELQQSVGMSRDMASEGLSEFSNGLQEIRKQLND